MAKRSKKLAIINTFGVFMYLSLMMQWLWAAVILIPPLLQNQTLRGLMLPRQVEHTQPIISFDPPLLLATVIAVTITIIILIIVVVMLVRLPLSIAKTSNKAATIVAQVVVPITIQHKPISAQKKRLLTARTVLGLKICASLLACVLLLCSVLFKIDLNDQIIYTVGIFLMGITLIWLAIQYSLARFNKIPYSDIL